MEVMRTHEEAEKKAPYCVALGSFDGLHLGHQKLIKLLFENASAFNVPTMIYTFESHPRKLLKPDKKLYLITENDEKIKVVEELGIDVLFLEDFAKVAQMHALDFIEKILVEKFKVKYVVVGYNYRFGQGGEGNAALLLEESAKYGFKVDIVPPVEINGETVSSTLIRHMIRSGEVEKLYQYLGRPYSMEGHVVLGKQNGRRIGIRTANINVSNNAVVPGNGIYLTSTIVDGIKYKSVSNIGYNPTFEGEVMTIETHILDFDKDIYNEKIEVIFLKKQRDEMKFDSVDALIAQIKKDIQARLDYLDEY